MDNSSRVKIIALIASIVIFILFTAIFIWLMVIWTNPVNNYGIAYTLLGYLCILLTIILFYTIIYTRAERGVYDYYPPNY